MQFCLLRRRYHLAVPAPAFGQPLMAADWLWWLALWWLRIIGSLMLQHATRGNVCHW
jgi:hypothetical protein